MEDKRIKENTQKAIDNAQNSAQKQPITLQILPRKALADYVKERIIGQDEFIDSVTVGIYRKLMFGLRSNMLILGGSGSGKTETLKIIADALGFPYTIESATEYTQSGYVGSDIQDIAVNLWNDAVAKQKIPLLVIGFSFVIMDEIDKKAEDDTWGSGHSVAGKAVQHRLLKFIDGMTIPVTRVAGKEVCINTGKQIFICLGAFEGLEAIRKERLKNNSMGFKTMETKQDLVKNELNEADFIQYGMIKEFMGRMDGIYMTRKLDQKDIQNITLNSKISSFLEYEDLLRSRGIQLKYSKKMIQNFSEKAFLMNTGARGIRNIANYVFEKIMLQIMDNPQTKYTTCRLRNDIAYDNTRFVLS